MICSFCGTQLGQDETRCRRCGRKEDDRLTGGLSLVTQGALAAAARPVAQEFPSKPAVLRRVPNLSRAAQTSLFPEGLESGMVIMTPARPKPRTRKPRAKTGSRVAEGQERLELLETAPAKPRTLGTTVEATIYCESRVATPLHRAVAAAMDWAMAIVSFGVFVGVFCLLGGHVVPTKTNLPVFGAALLLIGFTYSLLPAIACTETLGMRCARLRLTTFDGYPLDPRQRILRMAGSCLSVCSVVGLLWSLVDEESLAWQDHISGTFPTLAVDR